MKKHLINHIFQVRGFLFIILFRRSTKLVFDNSNKIYLSVNVSRTNYIFHLSIPPHPQLILIWPLWSLKTEESAIQRNVVDVTFTSWASQITAPIPQRYDRCSAH